MAGRSVGAKILDFGHKAFVFGLVSCATYSIFEIGNGVYHIIRINRNGGIPPPPLALENQKGPSSTDINIDPNSKA